MITKLKYYFAEKYSNLLKQRREVKEKSLYHKLKNKNINNIKKLDNRDIPLNKKEILLFAIMRNESLRLPHFISYYKSYGVDRFFFIDNNSTDNSIEITLAQDKVHTFTTKDPYTYHWFWIEHFLEKYGVDNWCLVVDIDELFFFPHAENIKLPELCSFLDIHNSTAVSALLLDMYSNKPLKDVKYNVGENPIKSLPYFDKEYYEVVLPYFDRYKWEYFKSNHFTGGMRERVFGKSKPVTSLKKNPLFKFLPGTYLGQGMHAINGSQLSDLKCVVFHTKFLNDCIQEANEESIREQHFNKASYYKDFKYYFDNNPDLCLACEDSILFKDSIQLVQLGIMTTSESFEKFALTQSKTLNEDEK